MRALCYSQTLSSRKRRGSFEFTLSNLDFFLPVSEQRRAYADELLLPLLFLRKKEEGILLSGALKTLTNSLLLRESDYSSCHFRALKSAVFFAHLPSPLLCNISNNFLMLSSLACRVCFCVSIRPSSS